MRHRRWPTRRARTAGGSFLGLRPIEAASQMLLGLIAAYQGRRRDMDRRLAAAEALAPDDADLRAGAWAWDAGRRPCSRRTARRQSARSPGPAPRHPTKHARILNPDQGPELLLQALASATALRWSRTPRRQCARRAGRSCGQAPRLRSSAAPTATSPGPARRWRLPWRPVTATRYSAPSPSGWPAKWRCATSGGIRSRCYGRPTRPSPDSGVRRAAAACQGLLRAAGQRAPRRRGGDASLPAGLLRAGVTRREGSPANSSPTGSLIPRSPSACTSRPERSKSTSRP